MSYDTDHAEPVRVHLTGTDVPIGGHHEPPRRPRYGAALKTFVLNASDPVQCILPLNAARCQGWIQPLTNAITVYTSKADAQSGSGGITIPATNTGPYPMHTTDPVWATAGTLPTSVCVSAIIEETGG